MIKARAVVARVFSHAPSFYFESVVLWVRLFLERVLFGCRCFSVVNFRGVRAWLERVGFWRCCVCGCKLSVLNCSEDLMNVCVSCERSLGS